MNYTKEQVVKDLEKTIGELYKNLYRLRQLKEYQEEYNTMNTLSDMLIQDKLHMLKKGYVKT